VFLGFLVNLFLPALANGKVCGKITVQLPGRNFFVNNNLITLTYKDDKITLVQIRDENKTLLKEIEIDRIISAIFEGNRKIENGFIYLTSDGKYFHYDLTKGEKEINQITSSAYCSYSMPDSMFFTCINNENKIVYDFKSQTQFLIPTLEITEFDRALIYIEKAKGNELTDKVGYYDFEKQTFSQFEVKNASYPVFISENHFTVYLVSGELYPSFVRAKGQWRRIDDSKTNKLTAVLNNGDLVYNKVIHKKGLDIDINMENINDFNLSTEIVDGETLKPKVLLKDFYVSMNNNHMFVKVEFPLFKWSFYTVENFKKIIVGEAVNPIYIFNEMPETFAVSKSGKWALFYRSNENQSHIFNLETGKKIRLPIAFTNSTLEESEDGVNLQIKNSEGSGIILNTKSEKIRKFKDMNKNFDGNFNNWYKSKNLGELSTIKNECLTGGVKVVDDSNEFSLSGTLVNGEPISIKSDSELIKNANLKSYCESSNHNFADWDKITPPIIQGTISKAMALLYLKRFQKLYGYQPEKHGPVMMALLDSDLIESESFLINEALKVISFYSPDQVRMFYNLIPFEKKMPFKWSTDESKICQSQEDKTIIKTKFDGLKSWASNSGIFITIDDLSEYKPFKNEFLNLSTENRLAILDGLAENLSLSAGKSFELTGVFQSKLKIFAKKYIRRMMGENAKVATDLAVAMRSGSYVPIALSTESIEDGFISEYEDIESNSKIFGFDYKVFNKIKLPKTTALIGTESSKQISWVHEDKDYIGEIRTKVLPPLANLIPVEKSPNYAAIKRDKKLTGMMIIGSNLAFDQAEIVDEYITYFENSDFEFDEPQNVSALDFFKNKVISGELDYLIKEAHSDGDEKNLILMNKVGKMLIGKKLKKDGTLEIIYLIYPVQNDYNSVRVSNEEFGEWVRARGVDSFLYYLNASCSSERKVISEIAAVRSPNFVPFPSVSTVMTFLDTKDNGTRHVLTGIRNGKTYEEIRKKLQSSENYKLGKDKFLFPDDPVFETVIRKNLIRNIQVEATMRDSTGKEIFLDQFTDH